MARVPEESGIIEEAEKIQDPMVCDPIRPFIIQVTLKHPQTGKADNQEALIDTGCTHCLLWRSISDSLGVHIVKLRVPIVFEQMDGSTLGGQTATHFTKLVRLKIGEHWERVRFFVVDRMIEPIILGLSWLDKREPTI